MVFFPELFARIFTKDAVLIENVKKTMPVFVAGMSIFGLQRACQNTFVAVDEAKISIFIALLRKVFLLIPLALILPHFMGVMGVFTAETVADATAAICCTTIFIIKFPKILQSCEVK
jgi:Na+-driven multidrug efflux pump